MSIIQILSRACFSVQPSASIALTQRSAIPIAAYRVEYIFFTLYSLQLFVARATVAVSRSIVARIFTHLSGAQENKLIVRHPFLGNPFGRQNTSHCNRGCALYVVVKRTVLGPIFVQEAEGIVVSEVLKLNTCITNDISHNTYSTYVTDHFISK